MRKSRVIVNVVVSWGDNTCFVVSLIGMVSVGLLR